ncbi:DUF4411 family protein [Chloroflexota bacterium]
MSDRIFIIDTDGFIHAYNYDFPPGGDHAGFWDWLNDLGSTVDIVIPEKVFKEIKDGNDGLDELILTLDNIIHQPTKGCLPYLPTVLPAYGMLTETDLEIFDRKADQYVIAHAIELGATVVTNEVREPGRTAPRNKKFPDICDRLGVNYMRYPHFIWEMRGS